MRRPSTMRLGWAWGLCIAMACTPPQSGDSGETSFTGITLSDPTVLTEGDSTLDDTSAETGMRLDVGNTPTTARATRGSTTTSSSASSAASFARRCRT